MSSRTIFNEALKLSPGDELIVPAFDQSNQNSLRVMLYREKKRCIESDTFPEIKAIAAEIYFRSALDSNGAPVIKVGRRPKSPIILKRADGTTEKVEV